METKCFYCGAVGDGQPASDAKADMYSNLVHSGNRTQWNEHVVTIPRCERCCRIHKAIRYTSLSLGWIAFLGVIALACTSSSGSGNSSHSGDGAIGGFIIGFAASVIITLVARALSYPVAILLGTQHASNAAKSPNVLAAKERGWKLGYPRSSDFLKVIAGAIR